MSRTTVDLTPEGPVGNARTRRRLVIGVTATMAMILATVGMVAWLTGGDDDTTTAGTAPSTAAPAMTADQTTTEPQTTTALEPSAADVLTPFLAAAETLDAQLRAAATAINAGGPPWTGVSQEMADAVQAAALEPVAETIPPGLPDDLLQSVILVYSDLSSRRHAIESFSSAPDLPHQPIDLLAEVANGHAAAARFDDDVAALRSRAESTPPVTIGRSDSREAAETLLLVRFVELANGGCDSRGGSVFPELPSLDWISSAAPDAPDIGVPDWDGHVGGIEFSADLGPDGTWEITIWAC
jgi:hypothetical protein